MVKMSSSSLKLAAIGATLAFSAVALAGCKGQSSSLYAPSNSTNNYASPMVSEKPMTKIKPADSIDQATTNEKSSVDKLDQDSKNVDQSLNDQAIDVTK